LSPVLDAKGTSHSLSLWQRSIQDIRSLSGASIPEIVGKCVKTVAFAGSSAKYLGQKERKGMKKADNKQTKKDLQCQANLCGRDNWLKALGSVAIYLADRSAILTNDIFLLC